MPASCAPVLTASAGVVNVSAVAARIVFIILPFSIVGVIAVHAVVFRPRMRNLNIIEQVPPTASLT
jgi:hypothetical protein